MKISHAITQPPHATRTSSSRTVPVSATISASDSPNGFDDKDATFTAQRSTASPGATLNKTSSDSTNQDQEWDYSAKEQNLDFADFVQVLVHVALHVKVGFYRGTFCPIGSFTALSSLFM